MNPNKKWVFSCGICGRRWEYDPPVCHEAKMCDNKECLYPFSRAGWASARAIGYPAPEKNPHEEN